MITRPLLSIYVTCLEGSETELSFAPRKVVQGCPIECQVHNDESPSHPPWLLESPYLPLAMVLIYNSAQPLYLSS
jgi:hypothetical protein